MSFDSYLAARMGVRVLFYALPNLGHFDWKNDVVHGRLPSPLLVASAAGYLASYGAAVLVATCALFSRKDFK